MATIPQTPSIPPALYGYLMETGAMVVNDAPADRADQRALSALKTAQIVRRGRARVAELPALQDDAEARRQLGLYLQELADLVRDRIVLAGEVGMGWARITQVADTLLAAKN